MVTLHKSLYEAQDINKMILFELVQGLFKMLFITKKQGALNEIALSYMIMVETE